MEGVPKSLPPIIKAYRIQDKVKGIGFEFDSAEDAWAKVEEELEEYCFLEISVTMPWKVLFG